MITQADIARECERVVQVYVYPQLFSAPLTNALIAGTRPMPRQKIKRLAKLAKKGKLA